MKQKITVRISEQIAERLQAAAALLDTRKSYVVERALDRFLAPDADGTTVAGQLERVGRRLDALEYDLRIVSETVALHARYHLTVTPSLPIVKQREACVLGSARFDELAAQVARRVNMNLPLMKQVMDRLIASTPGLFSDDIDEGLPPRSEEIG